MCYFFSYTWIFSRKISTVRHLWKQLIYVCVDNMFQKASLLSMFPPRGSLFGAVVHFSVQNSNYVYKGVYLVQLYMYIYAYPYNEHKHISVQNLFHAFALNQYVISTVRFGYKPQCTKFGWFVCFKVFHKNFFSLFSNGLTLKDTQNLYMYKLNSCSSIVK